MDFAIDGAWRDLFPVNLRSTQAKPRLDQPADPSFRNEAHWRSSAWCQSSPVLIQHMHCASEHFITWVTASEHNSHFRTQQPLPSNIASKQSCFWAISLPGTSLPQKAISLISINSSEHELLYLIPFWVKMRKCRVMLNKPLRSSATQDSCVPGHHCYHGCNGKMHQDFLRGRSLESYAF